MQLLPSVGTCPISHTTGHHSQGLSRNPLHNNSRPGLEAGARSLILSIAMKQTVTQSSRTCG